MAVTTNQDVAVNLVELNGKFERMMDSIETVKEKQEEMAENLSQIKDAMYNPDQGLYARVRELEQWKYSSTKLLWIVTTSVVGVLTVTIYKALFE